MTYFSLLIAGIILFVAAASFLAAELFIPSHGLLGIFAGLFAVAGVVAMFMASPLLGAISTFLLLIIAPLVLHYAIKYYPQSPVGKRVMLKSPKESDIAGFSPESRILQSLVGKRGTAATTLRPAGEIEVEGRRIDSLSEGEIIDAGSTIEIIRVSGLKVIVKAVSS